MAYKSRTCKATLSIFKWPIVGTGMDWRQKISTDYFVRQFVVYLVGSFPFVPWLCSHGPHIIWSSMRKLKYQWSSAKKKFIQQWLGFPYTQERMIRTVGIDNLWKILLIFFWRSKEFAQRNLTLDIKLKWEAFMWDPQIWNQSSHSCLDYSCRFGW